MQALGKACCNANQDGKGEMILLNRGHALLVGIIVWGHRPCNVIYVGRLIIMVTITASLLRRKSYSISYERRRIWE
jgi:hypothetical protein